MGDKKIASDSIVYIKSKEFSIRIVKLYQFLNENTRETILSKQILRSGTSIGANLAEAQFGISKKDFLNKLFIALKECAETIYWLELLYEAGYISKAQQESLLQDAESIKYMLISSCKTIKRNLSSK